MLVAFFWFDANHVIVFFFFGFCYVGGVSGVKGGGKWHQRMAN